MQTTITLKNIYEEDTHKAGIRGVDLAKAEQKGYKTPLSFVIPNELFTTFLEHSGLQEHIIHLYNHHPKTTEGHRQVREEIKKLLDTLRFSRALKEEFIEAYESLGINAEATDALHLVSARNDPAVTLIPSITYESEKLGLKGIQQNIKGEEAFLKAIKDCWLTLYDETLTLERQEKNIKDYGIAIIVQQQPKSPRSCEGTYRNLLIEPITLQAYQGLLDTEEKLTKDTYHVAKDQLQVTKTTIRQQAYKLAGEEESGMLAHVYLQEQGSKETLNHKQATEAARITKRLHVLHNSDIKAYFAIKEEQVQLLFLDKLLPSKEEPQTYSAQEEQPLITKQEQTREHITILQEDEKTTQPTIQEEIGIEVYALDENKTPRDYQETQAYETPSSNEEPQTYPAQEERPITIEQEQRTQPTLQEETLFDLFAQEETSPPQSQQEPQAYETPSSNEEPQNYEQPTNENNEQMMNTQMPEDAQNPATKLIIDVFELIETQLQELHNEHYGVKANNFEELLEALHRAEKLLLAKEDLKRLHQAARNLRAGKLPVDEELGLAYRLQQTSRK